MKNLVNISEGASLAMHGLALIAAQSPRRLTVREMADEMGVSEAHLAKVFQRLTRAGFVSSVRGPAGGFVLENKPGDITFLGVYEAMESPVNLEGCPVGWKKCSFSRCIFQSRLDALNRQIVSLLQDITLADFVSGKASA